MSQLAGQRSSPVKTEGQKPGNLFVGGCNAHRTAAPHSQSGDQSLCPVTEDHRSPAALARLPPEPSRHYPHPNQFSPSSFFRGPAATLSLHPPAPGRCAADGRTAGGGTAAAEWLRSAWPRPPPR